MPLSSHAVIALAACLPVLAICIYIIRWYRDRRKNNELEQGPGDEPDWEYWLNPVSNGSDATSEANLIHRPMTALSHSSKSDETEPILLKPLPAVLRHLHIAIYVHNPDKLLRLLAISDPMHAVIPQAPHVVYSFYFNLFLMAVDQNGKSKEIRVTKFKGSVDRFCAIESGTRIQAEIDGIIHGGLSEYQKGMVSMIARPQKLVLGEHFVPAALAKLTEEILGGRNSAGG